MEVYILALQARILLWTGIGLLALGLVTGVDPLAAAWRAALGGLLAMIIGGVLLRLAGRVFAGVAANEAADSEEAAA